MPSSFKSHQLGADGQHVGTPLDLVYEVDGEDKTREVINIPENNGRFSSKLSPSPSEKDIMRGQADSITSSNLSEFRDTSISLNMTGDRFFAVVSGDRLQLFNDEASADRYYDSSKEDWDNRPTTYVIYRHSSQGLLEENALESSITFLLQDNASKMK